jgi:uncharacterized protein YjbI with pentapeptide repeats
LHYADLISANLRDANLDGANLHGAILRSWPPRLQPAILRHQLAVVDSRAKTGGSWA